METIKYLRVSATTQCNANCWYCFNESQPFDNSMLEDIDGFNWLINQLVSDYGTEIIRFTGGEPLLNPQIFNMIKIVKNTGIKRVGLTTNGDHLLNKKVEILESNLDEIAIHLHEFDSVQMPVQVRRVIDYITKINYTFPNVRFNIVVTQYIADYILQIVKYCVKNNINLLLLDLLKAGNTEQDFFKNYCSLEFIREHLYINLSETIENVNSKIYFNSKSRVKLLKHYADPSILETFCTKNLDLHPILLTPNFKLIICTHFGKHSVSVRDAVTQRNSNLLLERIMEAKASLRECCDCDKCTVL